MNRNDRKRAFSLIEVNLAIFVASAGLLVLLSLFPVGLQQSEMAVAETQQSLFADFVLGTLEGNAMSITNWVEWNTYFMPANLLNPNNVLMDGLKVESGSPLSENIYLNGRDPNTAAPTEFPKGTQNYLRYKITMTDPPDYWGGDRKRVLLMVKSGKYGVFDATARCFVTDLVFLGM